MKALLYYNYTDIVTFYLLLCIFFYFNFKAARLLLSLKQKKVFQIWVTLVATTHPTLLSEYL